MCRSDPHGFYCMDMKDIPSAFQDIDLLWSEGAAYNIGFTNALSSWATAIKPGVKGSSLLLTHVRKDVSQILCPGH